MSVCGYAVNRWAYILEVVRTVRRDVAHSSLIRSFVLEERRWCRRERMTHEHAVEHVAEDENRDGL